MAKVAKVAKVATAATVEVVGMDDVEAVGAAAAVADSSVLAIPLASSSDSSVPATPVVRKKTWLQISHLAGEEHLLHLQVRSVDWLEECLEASNGEAEAQRLVEVKLVPLDQEHHDVVDLVHHHPCKEEPSPALGGFGLVLLKDPWGGFLAYMVFGSFFLGGAK